jgi:hypothetical protein
VRDHEDTRPLFKDPDSFNLTPDSVARHEDPERAIPIEAKWKLVDRPADAEMDDVRQVFAYSRVWRSPRALLVYPTAGATLWFEELRANVDDECLLGVLGLPVVARPRFRSGAIGRFLELREVETATHLVGLGLREVGDQSSHTSSV